MSSANAASADEPVFVRLNCKDTIWCPFGWQSIVLGCDVCAAVAPKRLGAAAKKTNCGGAQAGWRYGYSCLLCSHGQCHVAGHLQLNGHSHYGVHAVWAARPNSFNEFVKGAIFAETS